MKYKNHKKHRARLLTAVFAAVMLLSLLPITASARENGHTVLTEDYYRLTDGNAAKVPGLNYRCSGHGDKMIEYYAEVEDDGRYTVPGIIEKVGNKLRYVYTYYCPTCYSTWKEGAKWNGEGEVYDDGSSTGKSLKDYMEFVANNTVAGMAAYGYYYPPKDDSDNAPQRNYTVGTSTVTEQPDLFQVDENGCLIGTSGKALTTVSGKKPDEKDPLAHWDMPGAFAFYQFFYTGMSEMINKPTSADDPAWDTVRDMTRIYYMKRQQEGQLAGSRVNYSSQWYSYDYSMLGEWVVTDLMAEYKTGEICGYVSYVGQKTEIAVPETVTIPLYGKVKIIGVDIEDHNLKKVYINDNVTCIRRLSSVNLEEISGCKSLEYIEKYAFQNDVSLKSIPEMPKLDWIAMGAFEGCVSLRDIKLPDNMTFIDFTAFGWYDTVLGNYDIGMTDQSWEDFQYLSDLSDNDKILGITLYAKKGSTTYKLLDTLINKNDALTPALDDNGKPYFKSYGDAVAMMSGEVKEFTSHWNLKSSGDYKGNLASTDKDVDDSTGGRLGEYGEGEPSWSPKKVLEQGALTASLLLFFGITAGVAHYTGTMPDKKKPVPEIPKTYWGMTAEQWSKMGSDSIDLLSNSFEKMGGVGKVMKGAVAAGKAFQKYLDVYNETGNADEAWNKAFVSSLSVGTAFGMATDSVPAVGIWDAVSGLAMGTSTAADAVSMGGNAEHLADFFMDYMYSRNKELHVNTSFDPSVVYTREELTQRIADGAYGENIKNFSDAVDLVSSWQSIKDTTVGVFGKDGLGWGIFGNMGDTANEMIKGSRVAEQYVEWFNSAVKDFYTTGTKGGM